MVGDRQIVVVGAGSRFVESVLESFNERVK